jgi:hypothetical protein
MAFGEFANVRGHLCPPLAIGPKMTLGACCSLSHGGLTNPHAKSKLHEGSLGIKKMHRSLQKNRQGSGNPVFSSRKDDWAKSYIL